jgi:hypothetical protein
MEKLIQLNSEERYAELLNMQESLNKELKEHFVNSKEKGRKLTVPP